MVLQRHREMPHMAAARLPHRSERKLRHTQIPVRQIPRAEPPAEALNVRQIPPRLIVAFVRDADLRVRVRPRLKYHPPHILQPVIAAEMLRREPVYLVDRPVEVGIRPFHPRHAARRAEMMHRLVREEERRRPNICEVEPARLAR